MTARPVRTRWIRRDEPQPEPESAHLKKARNLPLPGPSILVKVPLHLLPEYLGLHSLQPMTRGEAQEAVQRSGKGRLAGVLYVKRVPKENS
jgi:hypothetical protein